MTEKELLKLKRSEMLEIMLAQSQEIDNLRGTGAVSVDGKVWSARMETPDGKAPKGAIVKAQHIEGVRLIVTEKK